MSVPVSAADSLASGRAALARAEWAEARARFEDAAAADDSAEAWEGVGLACWWEGDHAATFAARERSYRGYRHVGDVRAAARLAMWVASDHLDFRGEDAVAEAWLRRGRSLLEGHPPCTELGMILLLEADLALLAHNDPRTAERVAREALELARS